MTPDWLMIITVGLISTYLLSLLYAKHTVRSSFMLTRVTVSAFVVTMFTVLFIVYWQYVVDYAVSASFALLAGTLVGHFLAVEVERHKISERGLAHYVEHYLHVHVKTLDNLEWWSVVNVHTIIVTLLLVNIIGLNELIFDSPEWTRFIIVASNFLIGTTIPYLIHLWTIKPPHVVHTRGK